MLRAAHRREFDMVMAWSVDRLGRSLTDLVAFLSDIHELGIDVFLLQQGLDSRTSAGRAMFGMLSVFAEFERALIVERVRAGVARAKAKGTHCGRPRIAPAIESAIREQLATGRGLCSTARDFGVGVGTVARIKAAMKATTDSARC
jgi:DNA invertase Pin-like site-specific DNA recombinase